MTFVVNQAENLVAQGDGTCDATCTLRDAILAANANDGADTITFTGAGGDNTIYPGPLPAIDASDGITIDGTGADVQIAGLEMTSVGDGLKFYTAIGTPLHDVVVRNITVGYFSDGISVCPGVSGESCTYDASDILIEGVTVDSNQGSGIELKVVDADEVSIDSVVAEENGGRGVYISAVGDVTGLQVTDSTLSRNNDAGVGVFVNDLDNVTVNGNTVSENKSHGIHLSLAGTLSDSRVTNNILNGNSSQAINLIGVSSIDTTVEDNMVSNTMSQGINLLFTGPLSGSSIRSNTVTGSAFDGIYVTGTAALPSVIAENTVSGSGRDGIHVRSESIHTITRNSVFSNGQLGIDLVKDGEPNPGVTLNDVGDGDTGPNGLLNFPVLNGVSLDSVVGTACANCLVELFLSDNDPSGYGEGQQFLRGATANGVGDFAVSICGLNLLAGTKVTATATDTGGNTSEFSLNYTLPAPSVPCPTATPSPTPTASAPAPSPTVTAAPVVLIQGNLDCDPAGVTPRDALFPMLYRLDLPLLSRTPSCPQLANEFNSREFADVNCDGVIDESDSVAILAALAEIPLPVETGCIPIGEQL